VSAAATGGPELTGLEPPARARRISGEATGTARPGWGEGGRFPARHLEFEHGRGIRGLEMTGHL